MAIEWTKKVWNPITGCDKVSGGCKNCYAEGIAKRFWDDRKFSDVRCHEDRLSMPDKWKKPAKIFVNSMSDLFHKDVPGDFIGKIMQVIERNPQHVFQILTKRTYRMLQYVNRLKNIWWGVSAEDQKTASMRIPMLLETVAAVRWVSLEPLLGAIDLQQLHYEGMVMVNSLTGKYGVFGPHHDTNKLDWVVVGCESGARRRECKLEWIESIVAQCQAAGVAVFVKQISINGKVVKDIEKFPEHLRIREFPNNG